MNSETNEEVAIKKIGNAFDNRIDAKRTLREIKLLCHMDHENVLSLTLVLLLMKIFCFIFNFNFFAYLDLQGLEAFSNKMKKKVLMKHYILV